MEFLEKNFLLDVQNSQEKFNLPSAGLLIKPLTIFDELIDSPSKSSTVYLIMIGENSVRSKISL